MIDTILISAIINGLIIGSIYALISTGLNIIFGVLDIVNFAHGEFLMLSMYGTVLLLEFTNIHPFLALAVLIPIMFIIGVITQRVVFQPVLDAPGTMQIFISLGLLLIFQNAALFVFGSQTRSVNVEWASNTIEVFGANVTYGRLFAFGLAIISTVLLFAFLRYTHTGQVIRATAQDSEGAELMGINTKVVYMITFGLGLALVAVAGVPLTMIYFVTPTIGIQYVLIAFVVVVLGGLGNLKGAFYAGLFIGVLESVAGVYIGAEIAPAIYFILFIAVLYARSRYGTIQSIIPKTLSLERVR